MTYDWEGKANQESTETDKLPAGQHQVQIVRLLRGRRNGGEFVSKAGDPQLMVIFADEAGREAGTLVTLSEAAGWVLAKILSAAGANLKRMSEAGVTPAKFADLAWAEPQLVGRKLTIQVEWPEGSKYPKVTPVRAPAAAAEAEDPDTIPF